MRRADRLFQIIQILRVQRTVTAKHLATELEVSERTVYRDVADLIGCGVPIDGEAGVGYALRAGLDLPPLMFTEAEIEALVVGARMVEAWGDPALARAARHALAKAETAMPDKLRQRLQSVEVYVPNFHMPESLTRNLEPLREAIGRKRKVHFEYKNRDDVQSERTARPLGLFFWGRAWTAVAWCELRDAFRSFRPDRMENLRVLDETIPDEPERDLQTFLQWVIQRSRGHR